MLLLVFFNKQGLQDVSVVRLRKGDTIDPIMRHKSGNWTANCTLDAAFR